MPPPSIAIIGAGPAGLSLANLLAASVPTAHVTIFEHSASAKARHKQGGTLDLHGDAGLLALTRMGLRSEVRPYLRYDGEALIIADLNGCELISLASQAPPPDDQDDEKSRHIRPEIDRERLVDILLHGLGEEKVQWGKHLKTIDTSTNILHFQDGSTAGPFDLVAGADGAWSKVRHVLTPVMPQYSGICGIEAHVPTPSKYPRVDKLVGRGSYFSFSGGRSVMAQRMGDASLKAAVYFRRPEAWIDGLVGDSLSTNPVNKEALRTKILQEELHEWCPAIREIIEVADLNVKWKLYELPLGTTYPHKEGYTLIGDAAHLCTPFAGLGVNAAMLDALQLADAISEAINSNTSLDDAIRSYEEIMFPRARSVQEKTNINKIGGFAEDAPLGFLIGNMKEVAKEVGWPLDGGVLYFLPISRVLTSIFWLKSCFTSVRRSVSRSVWGEKSFREGS